MGRGRGGKGRGQILRRRESLFLYRSFNTLFITFVFTHYSNYHKVFEEYLYPLVVSVLVTHTPCWQGAWRQGESPCRSSRWGEEPATPRQASSCSSCPALAILQLLPRLRATPGSPSQSIVRTSEKNAQRHIVD
jgi:hypothetical protein